MFVRVALPFLVIGLLAGAPSLTQAQEETKAGRPLVSFKTDDREPIFGDRFTLKAGYKVWVAKWQTPTSGTINQSLITNSPSALNGPTVTAIYKVSDGAWFNSVFVNLTSLRDGFDFSNTQTGIPGAGFAVRRDTSITAGLALWEGFGLFAGYYRNDQRFLVGIIPGVSSGFYTERTLEGPIFGGFGTVPVSQRWSVYGNLAYGILSFDQEFPQVSPGAKPGPTDFDTKSAQGYVIEAGLNIVGPRIWKIGTELQVGFRSQNITKTFGQNPNPSGQANAIRFTDVKANDITWGPTFSINAVF